MRPPRLAILAAAALALAGGIILPGLLAGGWSVVRVIDGDTLIVQQGRTVERVRLLGIDAPERGSPGYVEAGDALRRIVGTGPLRLERDPSCPDRDSFGRLLRHVWRGDRLVSAELVAAGHAVVSRRYPPRLHADFMSAAEKSSAR